jgi:hypothetical protein
MTKKTPIIPIRICRYWFNLLNLVYLTIVKQNYIQKVGVSLAFKHPDCFQPFSNADSRMNVWLQGLTLLLAFPSLRTRVQQFVGQWGG